MKVSRLCGVFEKFKYSEKDINENDKISIWQLIRNRYMKSGYSRLFDLVD